MLDSGRNLMELSKICTCDVFMSGLIFVNQWKLVRHEEVCDKSTLFF